MKRYYRLIVDKDLDGRVWYDYDDPAGSLTTNPTEATLHSTGRYDGNDPLKYWEGVAEVQFLPEDQQMRLNNQPELFRNPKSEIPNGGPDGKKYREDERPGT